MTHRNYQFALDANGNHIGIYGTTKIVGNYAYKPGIGWYRYSTLATATWNYHLNRGGCHQ